MQAAPQSHFTHTRDLAAMVAVGAGTVTWLSVYIYTLLASQPAWLCGRAESMGSNPPLTSWGGNLPDILGLSCSDTSESTG